MCEYSWRVPLTLAGELKASAYADLGGLGAKQGPPASFFWTVPNLLPVLLPWLVILGLLALPSNRQAGAWWIWVPLGGVALVGIGVQTAAEAAQNEGLGYLAQACVAVMFGLAAVWLLGAALARCWRALGMVFAALAFTVVGLLAFALGPVWEQLYAMVEYESQILWYLAVFALLNGLAYAGALNLVGWRCRKRFSRVRCSLWLPVGLWAVWLVGGGLTAWILSLLAGGNFSWLGLVIGPVVLTLVNLALMLPLLILSFTSSFYCERLRSLLRVPPVLAAPATLAPPPAVLEATPQ